MKLKLNKNNIILLVLIIHTILLWIYLLYYKKKEHNQNIKIISYIESILLGEKNNYDCYKNTEFSNICFLLKNLEYNCQLIKEQAHKEKEGIKYTISNLSHQLKTPLSNIKLYGALLEDETLPNEKKKVFQEKMRNQIEKLDWIINSIIKCSRLEEDAIQFVAELMPIQKTIITAIDTVLLKASKKNIEIISKNDLKNITLYHNMKWTSEVFVNLLENAIKYSPENSIIEIKVEQLENYTKISVEDEGIGIRQEEYYKIFQRFYRSKDVEHEEGSGIGLYLCKLILEKEKGNIIVSSKYGKGSNFQVYLLNNIP